MGYCPGSCKESDMTERLNKLGLLPLFAGLLLVMCSVSQLCPTLCDPARLLSLWRLPGKNIGNGLPFPTPFSSNT